MGDPPDCFGTRLDLALRALNISRVQLATLVGVHKSLVSRWLSSEVHPTTHNIARISNALAKAKPGFNAIQWERPLDEFRAFLGLDDASRLQSGAPSNAAPEGIRLRSQAMSAQEIAAGSQKYTGLYALFRRRFMNDGRFVLELVRIYGGAGGLFWESQDGGNPLLGTAMLIRNRLHLIGEGISAKDGITLHVLNGTGDRHAMVMDGMLVGIAGDRFSTPTAAKVVMLRIAHPLAEPEADAQRFRDLIPRMAALNNGGDNAELVPESYRHVIDNRTYANPTDTVFRVCGENSVSRSDFENGHYEFVVPEVRELILGLSQGARANSSDYRGSALG